jgi:hypothetical protein
MAVLVFGAYFGYSAITLAAKASLPGEALYPIKVLSENIQLAATIGDEGKVKLKMDFISRRGDELQQLAKNPADPEVKAANISATVKQITQDVQEVNTKMDKMSTAATAVAIISTAKVVDDKTLKVEKDIVDAHTALSTEVKKDVAKDVKEAIAATEVVGTNALSAMVNKSSEQGVKDANQAVSDKELATRVGDRIASTELAVAVAQGEVNKISTSTSALTAGLASIPLPSLLIGTSSTSTMSGLTTTTLQAAVQAVSGKPQQAQVVINQAKTLLDKGDFTSALAKIVESKAIVADVLEKAPLIDVQIKVGQASSTAVK